MTFTGRLNRVEFLVAIFAIGLLSFLAQRGISAIGNVQPDSTDELLRNIMIAHGIVALICLPIIACRLKDMCWPVVLSALVLIPVIPQSLFLFHLLTGGEHASHQLAVYLSAINYSEIFVLAFVLLLLIWPGRDMLENTGS